MANKHKKQQDWDDWEDASEEQDLKPDVEVVVSLKDFCVMDKVDAFVAAYQPCDESADGAEFFDDARLRETLKAYVCGFGDPLKCYMDELKTKGFRMTMNTITCEPGIFAIRRY